MFDRISWCQKCCCIGGTMSEVLFQQSISISKLQGNQIWVNSGVRNLVLCQEIDRPHQLKHDTTIPLCFTCMQPLLQQLNTAAQERTSRLACCDIPAVTAASLWHRDSPCALDSSVTWLQSVTPLLVQAPLDPAVGWSHFWQMVQNIPLLESLQITQGHFFSHSLL